jgi:hypothetical protein
MVTSTDAVTADFDGNSVSILLGDGSGGFAEPLQFPARGRPRALFALDLDGDGDLDLATADYEADRLSFWRGDGNAIIERTGSMPAGNGPEVIAAGNIDSDAHLDLLTVDARGNTVTAFIADGQGSFTARPAHAVGERPRFALLRDLDGDGFDDLIAANHFEETVFIDRNIAGTRFRRQTVIDSGGLDRPLEVVLADVTGDGLGDLLVTWFESDVFTIAAGTEDPFEFAAPTVHATGRGPVGMAVADCDGDGDADVLVANASEDTASVYVSRLVAAPEGSFRRADPNADGGVNLSDAVFVLGHLFAGGSRPSCMKSADMDDNGTLDLGDPIYLLGHLTRGGAPPPAPYPSCGEDATSDGLGCDAHPPCGNRD